MRGIGQRTGANRSERAHRFFGYFNCNCSVFIEPSVLWRGPAATLRSATRLAISASLASGSGVRRMAEGCMLPSPARIWLETLLRGAWSGETGTPIKLGAAVHPGRRRAADERRRSPPRARGRQAAISRELALMEPDLGLAVPT